MAAKISPSALRRECATDASIAKTACSVKSSAAIRAIVARIEQEEFSFAIFMPDLSRSAASRTGVEL